MWYSLHQDRWKITRKLMQTYNVKAGNKLFWPVQAKHLMPMPYAGYDFEFSLSESCWFEGGGGQRFQQNKALGITGAFSDNNSRAALISWQVTHVEGVFLATGYTNFADKSWVHGKPGITAVPFAAGETVTGKVRIYKRITEPADFLSLDWIGEQYEVRYEILGPRMNSPLMLIHRFDRPWHGLYREIFPWFGGKMPAPQDMQMQYKLKRIRK